MVFSVGNRPSPAERKSWEASLPVLAQDLVEAGLSEVEILSEYQLPFSSKRVDAVLCGIHPKTGRPSVLVVELKQWTAVRPFPGSPELVLVDAYGSVPVLHPAEQVHGYCEYLEDFNRYLENSNAHLAGAAYLHNWNSSKLSMLDAFEPDEKNWVFTSSERGEWHNFLKEHFAAFPGKETADGLLASKLAPSKQLMENVADEIRDSEQFVLLDEQQVAYSIVMNVVRRSREANIKTAVIVTGGPGTGKSVIAVSLLAELGRQGRSVLHATGSRAFRNSLRKIAGHRAPKVQKLFTYFNSFMTAEPNALDALICDEAHRVRETSANRYTSSDRRTGTPQIEELLRAARVPVFLLDSRQVVRKGEIGTPEYIAHTARELGLEVIQVDLDGQFRCGGSRIYESWIQRLLELEKEPVTTWRPDSNFEVLLAKSPRDMETFLARKNSEGSKGRISAGFCWSWSEPNPDGTLPLDVQIGDWHKPWNVKGDRGVGDYLSGELWAIDPMGFDQIGCVYTAQGFEYDWNGVILGPDLVWRIDRWIAIPSGSRDPAMRGVSADAFDSLVKNTYKVLLTRGLLGTILFSVDPETQKYLETMLTNKVD